MPSPAAGAPARRTQALPAAAAPDRAAGGGGAGGGGAGPGEGSASGEQGAGAAGRPTPERTPRSSGAPQPMSSGSPAALARAAEVRAPAPDLVRAAPGALSCRGAFSAMSQSPQLFALSRRVIAPRSPCLRMVHTARHSGAGVRKRSAADRAAPDAVETSVVAPAGTSRPRLAVAPASGRRSRPCVGACQVAERLSETQAREAGERRGGSPARGRAQGFPQDAKQARDPSLALQRPVWEVKVRVRARRASPRTPSRRARVPRLAPGLHVQALPCLSLGRYDLGQGMRAPVPRLAPGLHVPALLRLGGRARWGVLDQQYGAQSLRAGPLRMPARYRRATSVPCLTPPCREAAWACHMHTVAACTHCELPAAPTRLCYGPVLTLMAQSVCRQSMLPGSCTP
jgi:hypothetical protein